MRFESTGLLHFLKALALIGAWVLFFYVDYDDLVELPYYIGKLDLLFVAFVTGIVVILLSVPATRLLKEYRAWKVLTAPFRIVDDPFIDVDLKEESYGELLLEGGYRIKRVATFASERGVIVRKAAYPKLFPTFEIKWGEVSNVYFVGTAIDERFGSDPFGVARVTLKIAEELILVLPWRKQFNVFLPDGIGLQFENHVGKCT